MVSLQSLGPAGIQMQQGWKNVVPKDVFAARMALHMPYTQHLGAAAQVPVSACQTLMRLSTYGSGSLGQPAGIVLQNVEGDLDQCGTGRS